MKYILIIIMLFFSTFYIGCDDKPLVVDPHNKDLINVSLDELKATLPGNWLLTWETRCGFLPCYNIYYTAGQQDVFSFLPLDTVKRVTASGVTLVYDKATITRSTPDNIWFYSMAGGLRNWAFLKIRNDTLIAEIDYSQGSQCYLVGSHKSCFLF